MIDVRFRGQNVHDEKLYINGTFPAPDPPIKATNSPAFISTILPNDGKTSEFQKATNEKIRK